MGIVSSAVSSATTWFGGLSGGSQILVAGGSIVLLFATGVGLYKL